MHIPGYETNLECLEAEIPQFTTLVSTPALRCFALRSCGLLMASACQKNHMYGCTFAGPTGRFVSMTVMLHSTTLGEAKEQRNVPNSLVLL